LHRIKYLNKFLLPQINFQSIIKNFFPAVFFYSMYFLVGGFLLALLCDCVVPAFQWGMIFHITLIWPLAWLAGFVVIGAPAGLGVREALLIALLGHLLGSSNALLITILFRIILTLGDVVFASSCIWFKRKAEKSKETMVV